MSARPPFRVLAAAQKVLHENRHELAQRFLMVGEEQVDQLLAWLEDEAKQQFAIDEAREKRQQQHAESEHCWQAKNAVNLAAIHANLQAPEAHFEIGGDLWTDAAADYLFDQREAKSLSEPVYALAMEMLREYRPTKDE